MTFRPPFFVPRPNDDTDWYPRQQPPFIALLNSTKPRLRGIPATCRFEQDDEPVWSAREKPNNSFWLLNSINPLPIRRMPWQYKQDDEPFWEAKPRPPTATQLNAITVGLPVKWRWPSDDEPFWQGRPVATNVNTFPSVKPKTPVQWRFFDTDDEPFWQGKPVGSVQPLLSTTKPRLLGVPARYRFEADDEAFWQGKPNPLSTTVLLAATVSLPVKWRFPVDDEPFWQARPVATNVNTFPAVKPPIIPLAWRHYDDPSDWQKTLQRNIALTTSTVPAIYNVIWKHWDDPSDWHRERPRSLALLTAPLPTPPTANPKQFHSDDPDYWQWKQPYTLALKLVTVGPAGLAITDTTRLQLPINAILMGQQDYEEGHTEIEANDPNYRTRITVSYGGGGKLSSNDPGFTTKTSKKGYD